MKIYTSMPQKLKPFYRKEIENYVDASLVNNQQKAWRHLERAHILGQRYPLTHSIVHWKMLQFGIKMKSGREVLGQLPRLFFGGVKSFVGKVPVGNPGGSNVPALKSFPINQNLKEIFIKAGIDEN